MNTATRSEMLVALPYARRYARSLTGNQASGDALVAKVIGVNLPDMPVRLALYAAITRAAPTPQSGGDISALQRCLLLLTALEDLRPADAALVAGIGIEEASVQIDAARLALRAAAVTDVLDIEDEYVIAMDIGRLVEACGHKVVGIAASEADAIDAAGRHPPGLILADINLGHGGDGMVAVERILRTLPEPIPVIFVTAYPERLLTGERAEPAFVISKPFDPLSLAIATYQAVTAGKAPIG